MIQDSEEEDFIDVNMDLEGEKDLCSSFNEEEELDYIEHLQESEREEEEVSNMEQSDDEDSKIEHCVRTGNLGKLKQILKKREEDCKKFEKEVKCEKLKEQKDREMKQVLSKLTRVNQTRKELQQSLASSRQASLVHSPATKQKE